MNISDLQRKDKPVQAKKVFDANEKQVSAMQILSGHQLKEHVSKFPAFLICVTGEVVYQDENGLSEKMTSGDFVNIEPHIKHWIDSNQDSHLLLIK